MPADPATLKTRYPAFAAVPDATVTYWLEDAARIVTPAWGTDEEPAQLALAAHNMAVEGLGAAGGVVNLPAGVTSFRSGGFSATFSDAAAAASAQGGYGSTRYGREFQVMLRRNVGGPFLAGVAC
jgi:hypothetical protein